MIEVHAPPNRQAINEVWVYLSVDDTGEGVCAAQLKPGMWTTLMAGERRIADMMLPTVREVARLSKRKIRLVKFTMREEIMEIDP